MRMDGRTSYGYLVVCSYAIALLDFVSAVLFASVSGMLFAHQYHWTSLLALIFSMLWMGIIVLLLLGIYQNQLSFVRYWLVFTCLGIMLDAFLLLYGLTMAISVNWDGLKATVLPFVGLAVEMTFVYIVYIFYVDMIYQDLSMRVNKIRFAAGCAHKGQKEKSDDTKRQERKRLRKMYKREEKAVLKELHRKKLRGKV